MRWIFAHWGANKRHIFEPLARSLKHLSDRIAYVRRDDMDCRPDLLSAIHGGRYDGLLTWQRFYHGQNDILTALKSTSIKTVFLDLGFFSHYGSVGNWGNWGVIGVIGDSHQFLKPNRLRWLPILSRTLESLPHRRPPLGQTCQHYIGASRRLSS